MKFTLRKIERWKDRAVKKIVYSLFLIPTNNDLDSWLKELSEGTYSVTKHWHEYHQTPKREDYAHMVDKWVGNPIHSLGYCPLWHGKWIRLKNRLAFKKLLKAPAIAFDSHHIHYEGHTDDVELWTTFKTILGDGYYSVSVVNLNFIKNISYDAWVTREAADLNQFGSHVTLIVPTEESLTQESVEKALINWYLSKVEWIRGHWTYKSKTLPTITAKLNWEKEAPEWATTSEAPTREEISRRMAELNRGKVEYYGLKFD